jgi:L-threonylcarbamoyladenylate synthase
VDIIKRLSAKEPARTSGGFSVRTYRDNSNDVAEVCAHLKEGHVIALPTETVYGLAGDASKPETCQQIFKIKGRPLIDPLIVHIADLSQIELLAEWNPLAQRLADHFWPGALTLILKKKPRVPDIVTAGLNTVAIRMPAHPLMQKVLRTSGLCLAAPSANPFGYVSPTSAQHVIDSLGDRIIGVLDGGECQIGIESTIIDVSDGQTLRLLRPGGITRERIEQATGVTVVQPLPSQCKAQNEPITAPGMLARHYSPHTPLSLFAYRNTPTFNAESTEQAVLWFQRPSNAQRIPTVEHFWLTEDGNLAEAAHNIFNLLRRLDQGAFSHVFVEKAPDAGLGLAINDRLRRAAERANPS